MEKYRMLKGMCAGTKFILTYMGKHLDPSKTLGDYEIDNDTTFQVMIRLTGC